jgi:hypothetical protein
MTKKTDKALVFLVLIVILTFISMATVYLASQLPSEEALTNVKCVYSSNALYNWTATLGPNIIDNNATTVSPDEGPLYSSLTREIDIALNYTFEASQPAEAEITYHVEQDLKTPQWKYALTNSAEVTTNQTQIEIQLLPFNKTQLETLKKQIDGETGTTSTEYSFEIIPTFKVNANTPTGPIDQVFTPTIAIDVGQTNQGNTITIENLQQNETGTITENAIVTHNEVTYERYASYIFLVACVTGLGFSVYRYSKAHVSIVGFDMEKLTAPYRDLVIEAKEIPEFTEETPIITIKDLEELAKVAEILAQPIFHSYNGTEHTFFVFDSDMIYTYKISQKGSVNS